MTNENLKEMINELETRLETSKTVLDLLDLNFHCGYLERTGENLYCNGTIKHKEFSEFLYKILTIRTEARRKTLEFTK